MPISIGETHLWVEDGNPLRGPYAGTYHLTPGGPPHYITTTGVDLSADHRVTARWAAGMRHYLRVSSVVGNDVFLDETDSHGDAMPAEGTSITIDGRAADTLMTYADYANGKMTRLACNFHVDAVGSLETYAPIVTGLYPTVRCIPGIRAASTDLLTDIEDADSWGYIAGRFTELGEICADLGATQIDQNYFYLSTEGIFITAEPDLWIDPTWNPDWDKVSSRIALLPRVGSRRYLVDYCLADYPDSLSLSDRQLAETRGRAWRQAWVDSGVIHAEWKHSMSLRYVSTEFGGGYYRVRALLETYRQYWRYMPALYIDYLLGGTNSLPAGRQAWLNPTEAVEILRDETGPTGMYIDNYTALQTFVTAIS